MSNYFGGVSLGDKLADELRNARAPKLVGAATYVGIAPEMTTVLYAPGDKLGMAAAMASLVPIGICVALLTVFLCRRTAEDLWIGGGQIVCEILNGVLKLIIREPRPSSPVTNMPVDSYGMPSAHAQYMGYFALVIIWQTLKAPGISRAHSLSRIGAVLGISIFTAYSRYYLYYHTGRQVSIGFLVGGAFGLAWCWLLGVVRKLGLLDWALSLWPCRLMLVKDVSYSVQEEYKTYQESCNSKQKVD